MSDIFSKINASRELTIELQRELTARPAIAPEAGGQGEFAKAEWLVHYLSTLPGLQIEWHNAADARVESGLRPNFRVRLAGANPQTLWVIAHLDVVAPGDESLWTQSPWDVRVEDDVIFGRGVEDNQQALVSALVLLKALTEMEAPAMSFGLICVADEESGNEYGLKYLLNERPDWFKPSDLYLVPDHGSPSGLEIEIAEKSMLWLRVAVEGRQAHASMPQRGNNSLEAAAAMILAAKGLYELFPARNELFEPPISTFASTKIEANVPNINIIPGADTFYIDCRILPEYSLDEVRAAVRRLADPIEAAHGVKITISDVQASQSPPALDPKSDAVTRLSNAIIKVHNGTPTCVGIGGGTVAALLRRADIPAVVWSTMFSNPHVLNERSSISNTLADAAIMAHMLLEGEQSA